MYQNTAVAAIHSFFIVTEIQMETYTKICGVILHIFTPIAFIILYPYIARPAEIPTPLLFF